MATPESRPPPAARPPPRTGRPGSRICGATRASSACHQASSSRANAAICARCSRSRGFQPSSSGSNSCRMRLRVKLSWRLEVSSRQSWPNLVEVGFDFSVVVASSGRIITPAPRFRVLDECPIDLRSMLRAETWRVPSRPGRRGCALSPLRRRHRQPGVCGTTIAQSPRSFFDGLGGLPVICGLRARLARRVDASFVKGQAEFRRKFAGEFQVGVSLRPRRPWCRWAA